MFYSSGKQNKSIGFQTLFLLPYSEQEKTQFFQLSYENWVFSFANLAIKKKKNICLPHYNFKCMAWEQIHFFYLGHVIEVV